MIFVRKEVSGIHPTAKIKMLIVWFNIIFFLRVSPAFRWVSQFLSVNQAGHLIGGLWLAGHQIGRGSLVMFLQVLIDKRLPLGGIGAQSALEFLVPSVLLQMFFKMTSNEGEEIARIAIVAGSF